MLPHLIHPEQCNTSKHLKQTQWAIHVWGSWRLNRITVAKDESGCPPINACKQ